MTKHKGLFSHNDRSPTLLDGMHERSPLDDGSAVGRKASRLSADGREVPKWIAAEGNLYWRGTVVLHLAVHAYIERAIVDAFEKWNWESPIPNPLPLDLFGDKTQCRRNGLKNLNRHQSGGPAIHFLSVHRGMMCWCPHERFVN